MMETCVITTLCQNEFLKKETKDLQSCNSGCGNDIIGNQLLKQRIFTVFYLKFMSQKSCDGAFFPLQCFKLSLKSGLHVMGTVKLL